jgi:hypothetical protein
MPLAAFYPEWDFSRWHPPDEGQAPLLEHVRTIVLVI